MSKMSIRFYQEHEVRAIWDDQTNKWWFSAVDAIAAINGEDTYKKAQRYWHYIKNKNKDGHDVQFLSNTKKLKMTASDGKRYLTDVLDQDGISRLARSIHNQKAESFLEWFEYSDKTIDGRSQKKAYELFDSPIYQKIEIGTVKGLQQIHAFIFGGLYDFAGQIRTKNITKDNFQFAPAQFLGQTLAAIEAMPESTFDEIINKYVK